jgi:hypothetical protein
MTQGKFRDLAVGDTFDFVDESNARLNSYFYRCVKTGTRTYRAIEPQTDHKIGTVACKVYHVKSGSL